jgi:hypothetical protein
VSLQSKSCFANVKQGQCNIIKINHIIKKIKKMKHIFTNLFARVLGTFQRGTVVILCTLSIGFFMAVNIYGCREENPISSPKFVSLTYGGCNNESELSGTQKHSEDAEKDTIIWDYQNDTLKMSVGINYICCSDFNAIQTIDNNNISLQITETTLSPDQYCRCECYYTFDYYFTDLSQTSYLINVIFDAQDNSKDKNFTKNFNAL